MSDRRGQCAQRHDSRHMGQLGASSIQGVLRDFALRHVLNGADEDWPVRNLFDAMGDAPQMLRDASRCDNAKYKLRFFTRQGSLDCAVKKRQVLGMYEGLKRLGLDLNRSGLEFADPVETIGPNVLVSLQVRREAAGLAQYLSFRKVNVGSSEFRLARLQCLLRQLVLRHVLCSAHKYGTPIDVFAETADTVQILQGAAGSHDSEYEIGIIARDGSLDHTVEHGQVLGVNDAPKLLGRDNRTRLELADAVELIGPNVLIGNQVGSEASRRAYSLGNDELPVRHAELSLASL